MCGIAGILSFSDAAVVDRTSLVSQMCDAMVRRGPDDHDVRDLDECCLGHRRLSIIDLTNTGRQPLKSSCGRYFLTYNGEIYNYRDLRDELAGAGVQFRGTSDSEVLVESFAHWGLGALSKLRGIFAFAVWDQRAKKLYLARDQLGVKPLVYSRQPEGFYFASDIGALAAVLSKRLSMSRQAVVDFLGAGYISAPDTIYTEIRKLEAGCYMVVEPNGRPSYPVRYWDPVEVFSRRGRNETGDLANLVSDISDQLQVSVGRQLASDVPLGSMLSSGMDSLAVTTAAVAQYGGDFQTFSIGDVDPNVDESVVAEKYAAEMGTKHVTEIVTKSDAMDVLDIIPKLFGEPFGDFGAVSTFLASKMAGQRVKVVLSGDGGDELFFGYQRYLDGLRRAPYSKIPRTLFRAARAVMSDNRFDRCIEASGPLDLYARYCLAFSEQELGDLLNPEIYPVRSNSAFRRALERIPGSADLGDRMLLFDILTYLEGDNLTRVDRCSMYHSLEVRVPLLDIELVELVLQAPFSCKYSGGRRKYPLFKYLETQYPKELFDLPKRGFTFSLGSMLRTELRESVRDTLTADFAQKFGLSYPVISEIMTHHENGTRSYTNQLWRFMVLARWLEEQPSAII